MRIYTDKIGGGLPDSGLMDQIRHRAAALGANVLVFDCGPAGNVGQAWCTARGFAE
jgi:hypothetical protein